MSRSDGVCPFKIGDELAVCHSGFRGRIIHRVVKVTRILKTYFETSDGKKWGFGSSWHGVHHCSERGRKYSSTYATQYTAAIKAEQAEEEREAKARAIARRIGDRANHLSKEQIEALLDSKIAEVFPEKP